MCAEIPESVGSEVIQNGSVSSRLLVPISSVGLFGGLSGRQKSDPKRIRKESYTRQTCMLSVVSAVASVLCVGCTNALFWEHSSAECVPDRFDGGCRVRTGSVWSDCRSAYRYALTVRI